MKNYRKTIIAYLILLVMLVSTVGTFAGESAEMPALTENPLSLQITLTYKDEESTVIPIQGVTLEILQAASLTVNGGSADYALTEAFAEAQITLEGMTASASKEAAGKLDEIAVQKNLSGASLTTNAQGSVLFEDLKPGMYLVRQTASAAIDYEKMVPFLAMVPYPQTGSEENYWDYAVSVYPKTTIQRVPDEKGGDIQVRKRVYLRAESDVELIAKDDMFTVGLYLDPLGQVPALQDYTKDIHLVGEHSNTVTYTQIPVGTYYVFELDMDGNPILSGDSFADHMMFCESEVSNGGLVEITPQTVTEVEIGNYYPDLPDNYSYRAMIYVTKTVKDADDTVITVEEPFYAGIFTKSGDDYVLFKNLPMKQNEEVFTEVPLGGADGTQPITYYVFETDADGKRVDPNYFAYEITGDGQSVHLDLNNLTEHLTIINKKIPPTPTVTPTPSLSVTPTPEITPPGGNPPGDNPPSYNPPGIKTGDNSPVIALAAALVASAAVIALILMLRKKRRQ